MQVRGIRGVAASLGVAALAVSGSLVGSAIAAQRSTIKVTPNHVFAGKAVRVYGDAVGCPKGDRVTLLSKAFAHKYYFAGVPAVYTTAGKGGVFSVKTTIPFGRKSGTYTITGRCGGGNLGTSAKLTVYNVNGGY